MHKEIKRNFWLPDNEKVSGFRLIKNFQDSIRWKIPKIPYEKYGKIMQKKISRILCDFHYSESDFRV